MRLSYDHKGSDTTEAQRILDVGGFVMNNRVNGKMSHFYFCGGILVGVILHANPPRCFILPRCPGGDKGFRR